VERPGREAIASNVVGEMKEIGVVTVVGVAPDVLVKQQGVANDKRPEDIYARNKQANTGQQVKAPGFSAHVRS
jgi:hypothetical protein